MSGGLGAVPPAASGPGRAHGANPRSLRLNNSILLLRNRRSPRGRGSRRCVLPQRHAPLFPISRHGNAMPSRIIRDSAKTSPSLAALSAEAERLFWRLTLFADDYGRFDGDYRVILAGCFPLLIEKISSDQIAQWCGELEAVGTITFYAFDTRRYGHFPSWFKHQRKYPDRKNGSKFPEPPEVYGSLRENPGDSRFFEGKESKVKDNESKYEDKRTHLKLVDEDFLIEQEQSPVYGGSGINVRREYEKCKVWMEVNNRVATKRAFIDWLNKAEPTKHAPGKTRFPGVEKQ